MVGMVVLMVGNGLVAVVGGTVVNIVVGGRVKVAELGAGVVDDGVTVTKVEVKGMVVGVMLVLTVGAVVAAGHAV